MSDPFGGQDGNSDARSLASGASLRIAFTSFYLPSESKIGAGWMAHRLANAMVDRGHLVTMFSPCARPADANYDHVLIPLPGKLRTFRWAIAVAQLDFGSFDVLHAHGDDQFVSKRAVPVHVRTMHGNCFDEALHAATMRDRVRMFGLGVGELIAAARIDIVVGVSKNALRFFPWKRIVIPNSVDVDTFRPGEKSFTPSVLFVGTYGRRKRGRLLQDAFVREVLPAVPDAELWMVCTDAPSAPGVHVLGRLSDDELAERYRRAWVFSLPSSYEGFGVPYAEALVSGTAVVATRNAGAREVLEDGACGVLVDDAQLGSAIIQLLQDSSKRRSLESLGVARRDRYDQRSVAAAYEALYRRSPGRTSTPRPINRPMTRAEARPGDVIRDAVRSQGAPSDVIGGLPQAQMAELVALSRFHKVAPLVWSSIRHRSAPLDAATKASLAGDSLAATCNHLLKLSELNVISTVFAEAGLDWLVLKGPVLAELLYRVPTLRMYGDLDLLVKPGDLARAIDALTAVGGRVLERNWTRVMQLEKGEVNIVLASGVVVDLHWNLVYDGRVRRCLHVPAGDLFTRGRRVRLDEEVWVDTLGATDMLMHVAMHAGLSGLWNLGTILDVALCARDPNVDWLELAANSERYGTRLALVTALDAASQLMQLPVPPETWRPGGPGRLWTTGVRATRRLRSAYRSRDGLLSLHVVPASTRDTLIGSLGALGGTTAQYLRDAITDPNNPWTRGWRRDVPEPTSDLLTEERGGRSLDDFTRWVALQD